MSKGLASLGVCAVCIAFLYVGHPFIALMIFYVGYSELWGGSDDTDEDS